MESSSNIYALVTGGSGHIGQTVIRALLSKGTLVICADKTPPSEAVQHENLSFLDVDLSQENVFNEVRDYVATKCGHLNYLVNNAAFYDDMPGWGVAFEEESVAAWDAVLRVNLMAPFFLAQALHKMMPSQGPAAIVNVSSIYGSLAPDWNVYGDLPMTNPAAYGASKGGLEQITRWLAARLAPHIRVNAVAAGGVFRGQNPQFVDNYQSRTMLQRMATEEDIAKAINFLLSEDSCYITGQTIMVDGGFSSW